MNWMSGVATARPSWQAVLIRQARALQCNCPVWVLHGEAWHTADLWVIRYWAAWCSHYDGAQAQVEAEGADPSLRLLRFAKEKRFMGQRTN